MATWYDENHDRLPEAETRMLDTTVGRVLFNRILPEKVQFINRQLEKGGVKDLIAEVYEIYGQEVTTEVADEVKRIGFEFAMRSGTTIAVSDITVPEQKGEIIEKALKEVELVQRDFHHRRRRSGESRHGPGWQSGNHGQLWRSKRWLRPHFAVGGHARADG